IINGSTGHPSSAQSIASIGDTLVIGGYRMAASTAETGSGTVWTSSDGSTWSLAEIGRGSAFITVASDRNRVLALAPGASWTTTDGHTWTPGAAPPAPMTWGVLVGLPDGGFLAPGATNDPSVCSFWF